MGLTLHYRYGSLTAKPAQAESWVRAWHEVATASNLGKTTTVFHETFDDQNVDAFGAFYPGRRFMETKLEPRVPRAKPEPFVPMSDEEIQAAADQCVEDWEEHRGRVDAGLEEETPKQEIREKFAAEMIEVTGGGWLDLHPDECWFFWIDADGSEPLLIGLARYPAVVEHTVNGKSVPFETGLGVGWHWEGFAKTQYASLPEHGGDDHFVKVHTGFVRLLDRVREDLPDLEVTDESGYADHRDEAELRKEIRKWNSLVAGVTGRLKDAGHATESPILNHPEFEHLEAEGDDAFKDWYLKLKEEHRKEREVDPDM